LLKPIFINFLFFIFLWGLNIIVYGKKHKRLGILTQKKCR